jgi:hypothetical protein
VNYNRLLPDRFDTEYDSVIIYGKAYEIIEEQEKRCALMLLLEKYSKDYREQGIAYIARAINTVTVLKIQIEYITGKLGR